MSDLQSILQRLAERDAATAKAPPPTRVLDYKLQVDLRADPPTFEYSADADLLAQAADEPDSFHAPEVIHVTIIPREPLEPATERQPELEEMTFGMLLTLYG